MSRKIWFLMIGLLVVSFVGCGSSYESASYDSSASVDFLDMEGEMMEESAAMEAPMAADMDDRGMGAANLAPEPNVEMQVAQQERLIIRTGNLTLVVENTEETLKEIAQMAEANGGWVVNSSVYQYNDTAKSGDITIRIPSQGFNSAMDGLKAMAVEVDYESTSGQDVTEEYVDLSSRLGNLEATAARVRSFMEDAETVEEALAVNQELSRLEGEIEVIKGRMQYLSQSAAFSTITVQLVPDIVTQPVQVGGWRPEGVAKEALEALIGTVQVLINFLIWFVIYILPVLLLVGIPLWLVIRFVRRRMRRRGEGTETAVSTAATEK